MAARKSTLFDTGNVIRDYKYTQEISQMVGAEFNYSCATSLT
jgi:hypothetical protein